MDSSCDNVRVLIELIQRSMRALLSSACFLAAFASEHDDTPSRAPSLSLSTFSCFGKGGWRWVGDKPLTTTSLPFIIAACLVGSLAARKSRERKIGNLEGRVPVDEASTDVVGDRLLKVLRREVGPITRVPAP